MAKTRQEVKSYTTLTQLLHNFPRRSGRLKAFPLRRSPCQVAVKVVNNRPKMGVKVAKNCKQRLHQQNQYVGRRQTRNCKQRCKHANYASPKGFKRLLL